MINTYNMKELKVIIGVNDTIKVKLLMDDGDLPYISLSPHVYSFPKVGLEDWLIKKGLFRTPEEASEHIQQAIKLMKSKETKRKRLQKEKEAD